MNVIAKQISSSGGRKMTETHEKLLAAILTDGQQGVAEVCDCGTTEAHRKVTGESGFKLDQLAKLFDRFNIRIATEGEVVIPREEYESLWFMTHKVAAERMRQRADARNVIDLRDGKKEG